MDDFNAFKLMADSYRRDAEEGNAWAKKECRIYDFLATCDEVDKCLLFDSTAFNYIAKAYVEETTLRLLKEGTIDEDLAREVNREFAYLFSCLTAGEVTGVDYDYGRTDSDTDEVFA